MGSLAGTCRKEDWPDGERWACRELGTIFDPGCSTPGCPSNDGGALLSGKRDFVVHAPTAITSALIGALHDWVWGKDPGAAVAGAQTEAEFRGITGYLGD